MFEPSEPPRIFGLPCGVDFGAAVVDGLRSRVQGHPPETLARIELIVNTTRLQRRLRALFDQGPSGFLPKMRLISSFVPEPDDIGDAPTPLARKLQLVTLVRSLLQARPDLAPKSAVFDLADSIAALLTEMSEEGVAPESLSTIDVSQQATYWQRAQEFLQIVGHLYNDPDFQAAAARAQIEKVIETWQVTPPRHPIIIVGSTGSRGPAQLLMQAVARLPQGAVILPGVDHTMTAEDWQTLRKSALQEDHPQFRILDLCDKAGIAPETVPTWQEARTPSEDRNALVSLALRPAPVTHVWRSQGPKLQNLQAACADLTFIEAQSQREEALCIAIRLRKAAEDGTQAALVTPNRTLTRQVAAHLLRWGIEADDSAGTPLHLTAPGRFLNHVGTIRTHRLNAESLLALLKHPLCHSGKGRNDHLRLTRDLELQLRADGPPFPDAKMLMEFAAAKDAAAWGEWLLAGLFSMLPEDGETPLASHFEQHLKAAEHLAKGAQDPEGSGALWQHFDGMAARKAMDMCEQSSSEGPPVSALEYETLFRAILSKEQQRERDAGRAGIRIWGTLEARVMDADLLLLAGLNEGSWPEAPSPDPWLNRNMRQQVGLLLPERRIGLSAHDFQQAIAGKSVVLSRAIRADGAQTVPSRWLNRLTNLLKGLEQGAPVLDTMRQRGDAWIAQARRFEEVAPVPPAPRPSPRPPIAARPNKLSVTQLKTLVRDPYAIYARHCLGLRKLDPLVKEPDAAMRGTVLHSVLETFVQSGEITVRALLDATNEELANLVPWPDTRIIWQARMARLADAFVAEEQERQKTAKPVAMESSAAIDLPGLGVTLVAKTDRVDIRSDGLLAIYDYKTGTAPTEPQQLMYDRQLLVTAAMAEQGAFKEFGKARVGHAQYLVLGTSLKTTDAPLDKVPPGKAWEELIELIGKMRSETFGFAARRAMEQSRHGSDFDQLARFGEWDTTAPAKPEDLT